VDGEAQVPEIDRYAPGTPCWVDVVSRDIDATAEFYGALFGWELGGTDDGFGLFTLDDLVVAGIGPCGPDQNPVWSTYISVQDADATVALAEKAGGSVLMAPVDVDAAGRGAAFIDPTGGVISIWQPRAHIGARVADAPGVRCWSELITPDLNRAQAFYVRVFGWTISTAAVGGSAYSVAVVDGEAVAGLVEPPNDVGLPPHWSVTFAVEDCDAGLATVERFGGVIAIGATDIPNVGRFGAVAAPSGETFSILERAAAAPSDPG
jgi:predicted enzyme related to lactoylglutathione lyase